MQEPAVLLEHRDSISVITLNRPDEMNTMTFEALDLFCKVVDEVSARDETRVLVVTGKGKAFCAGANLKGFLQREDAQGLPSQRSLGMYEPFLKLLDLNVPVIAALNGHAVGGGFGLSLACDIRVASHEGKYGANFARLGLHPGMAISFFLPRLIGLARASELLYTGRLVKGEEAAAIGLVNRSVPKAEVMSAAMELAEAIAANAPLAVQTTKRTLVEAFQAEAMRAARLEAYAQAETLQTEDAKEGMAALLAKRVPVFTGR